MFNLLLSALLSVWPRAEAIGGSLLNTPDPTKYKWYNCCSYYSIYDGYIEAAMRTLILWFMYMIYSLNNVIFQFTYYIFLKKVIIHYVYSKCHGVVTYKDKLCPVWVSFSINYESCLRRFRKLNSSRLIHSRPIETFHQVKILDILA